MQALRKCESPNPIAQALHLQKMLQGGGKRSRIQKIWLIFMVDRVADAINTIKTNERIGRGACVLESTKFIRAILDVMKK